jgi:dTDP-4-amino-4,6-dideoxygalactose transaminase
VSGGGGGVLGEFKDAIRGELGEDVRVALFWKGRVALYAILKSLEIGEGDEVIIPGFTCVVVANAVIYSGATPVYADIDPRTYTATRDTIEPLITPRTRAIVSQNTFGLSADLDPLMEIASERGLEVIDDCAHGFGGSYKGRPNGITTRTSFFSTQWNKPISTGIGGFAVTTDPRIGEKLYKLERQADTPTAWDTLVLRSMYLARDKLVGQNTYWQLLKLYRWLGSRGLVIGSSQSAELEGPSMPRGYFKSISRFQAHAGLKALRDLGEAKEFRRSVADEYDELMKSLGKTTPLRPGYAEHMFLKYPVRVENRNRFMEMARSEGVRLGDWFVSPLHPIEQDLSPWRYDKGCCPAAERASTQLINLPTELDMSRKEIDRVKDFVSGNAACIL